MSVGVLICSERSRVEISFLQSCKWMCLMLCALVVSRNAILVVGI